MIAIALVIISSIPTISIPVKAEASVDGKLIYLETDSDGKIVCYGSVSPGFETNKYSYGEKVNPYARAGCEAKDDDGKLYAVIYYTKFHLDAYKRFTENFMLNFISIFRLST